MKKYLLLILLLLMPTGAWGANWFAGAGDTDFDAQDGSHVSSVWNSNADGTSGTYLDFDTGPANGDVFIANGATIAIDANIGSESVTVTLTTEGTDYGGTDGGGFTYDTAGNLTLYINVVAGTTDCLAITGSTGGGTIIGDITGGSGTGAEGVTDTHTAVDIEITGNVTGGSATNAMGITRNGLTGGLTISGTATGGSAGYASGISSTGTASPTVSGDCIGSATSSTGIGCTGGATLGYITVTGNIIAGDGGTGASGRIRWTPLSAKNYVSFDGGGTAIFASAYLASAADGTKITPANTAAKIATTAYFVKSDDYDGSTLTQGTASASSGGGASAW